MGKKAAQDTVGTPMTETDNKNGSRRRVLSITVRNEPAVLSRIAGLFSGRGWNIESLTVAEVTSSMYSSERDGVSRITIVTNTHDERLMHVVQKIGGLIPVLDVQDLTDNPEKVEADISLVKVLTDNPHLQTEIALMAQVQFRALSVRTRAEYIVLRFPGQERAARDFVASVLRFGVKVETVHSGIVAIA